MAPEQALDKELSRQAALLAQTKKAGALLAFAQDESVQEAVDKAAKVARALAPLAPVEFDAVLHVAEVRVRAAAHGVMVLGSAVKTPEAWIADAAPGQARAHCRCTPAAETHVPRNVTMATRVMTEGSIEPTFWPRDSLLDQVLLEAEQALADGPPGLSTLVGDEGLGKTTVLTEVAERHARSLSLRATRGGQGLLPTLVAHSLGVEETEQRPEVIREACMAHLGEGFGDHAWPSVARSLGLLSVAEYRELTDVEPGTPTRQLTARALANALLRKTREQPLVLCIDDSHAADYVSLDALELATLSSERAPLWVCVTVRPGFLTLRDSWGKRAEVGSIHELAPLSNVVAKSAFAELLHPVEFIPKEVTERLIALTGGVPLHMVELVSALAAEGAIRQGASAEAWFVAADELLAVGATKLASRLGQKVLSRLPDELSRFAGLCALFGDRFSEAEVEAALRLATGDVELATLSPSAALTGLLEHRVLVFDGTEYLFRKPMVQSALMEGLSDDDRRSLATLVFDGLSNLGVRGPRLAPHAERAGNTEVAARLYLEEAQAAEEAFQYVDAEQAYTRCIAITEDARHRTDALTGRGRIRNQIGHFTQAYDDLKSALTFAEVNPNPAQLAELVADISTVLDWMRDFEAAARFGRRAVEMIENLDISSLAAKGRLISARIMCREESFSEAIPELKQAIEVAERIGEPETWADAMALLGGVLAMRQDFDAANTILTELIIVSERRGDRIHLAAAYGNRFAVWLLQNEYERAKECGEDLIRVAREIGNFRLEVAAEYNQALVLYTSGFTERALQHARRAEVLESKYFEQPGPKTKLLLARILSAAGSLQEARDLVVAVRSSGGLNLSMECECRMVELLTGGATTADWNILVGKSEERTLDTRLEILFAFATWAHRHNEEPLVEEVRRQAMDIASNISSWMERFEQIGVSGSKSEVPPGAEAFEDDATRIQETRYPVS